jgi:hypothetical protein
MNLLKRSALLGASLMTGALLFSGCSSDGDGSGDIPSACVPDMSTMTVLGYPYQPNSLENTLNGGALAALTFARDGSVAYASTTKKYETEQFIAVNLDEVNNSTVLGSTGHIKDLATQPNTGTVYGKANETLVIVNEANGTTSLIADALPYHDPNGLAFDSDGTLYLTDNGALHTVDPNDGTVNLVLNLNRSYMALGYNPADGKLYGSNTRDDEGEIYTIDPSDGNETYVGKVDCPAGDNACILHDIAFNPRTGEMYGVMGGDNNSSDPDHLVGAVVKWGCQ